MGKNGMVQWAPGTRPQRMNREDGVYEMEMEALSRRVEERNAQLVPTYPAPYSEGDLLITKYGDFEIAGNMGWSNDGWWVNIRGAKHGAAMFAKVPDWFLEQYEKLKKEFHSGSI